MNTIVTLTLAASATAISISGRSAAAPIAAETAPTHIATAPVAAETVPTAHTSVPCLAVPTKKEAEAIFHMVDGNNDKTVTGAELEAAGSHLMDFANKSGMNFDPKLLKGIHDATANYLKDHQGKLTMAQGVAGIDMGIKELNKATKSCDAPGAKPVNFAAKAIAKWGPKSRPVQKTCRQGTYGVFHQYDKGGKGACGCESLNDQCRTDMGPKGPNCIAKAACGNQATPADIEAARLVRASAFTSVPCLAVPSKKQAETIFHMVDGNNDKTVTGDELEAAGSHLMDFANKSGMNFDPALLEGIEGATAKYLDDHQGKLTMTQGVAGIRMGIRELNKATKSCDAAGAKPEDFAAMAIAKWGPKANVAPIDEEAAKPSALAPKVETN